MRATQRPVSRPAGMWVYLAIGIVAGAWVASAPAQTTITSEQIDPVYFGPSTVESMADMIERDRLVSRPVLDPRRERTAGIWQVPSRRSMGETCSGSNHVVNKWGDPQMGIGFPQLVNFEGVFVSTPASEGTRTPAVRVVGYRAGKLVARTDWFDGLSTEPTWFDCALAGVDRIEFQAAPVLDGAGWYALDDLTFTWASDPTATPVVVGFDDLPENHRVSGSGYAGLIWETGTGDLSLSTGVPSPQQPRQLAPEAPAVASPAGGETATPPNLLATYQGVLRGDAGSMSYPPDTDGAVGPNHYVITVNRNFAVYDKSTGAELTNILLGTFLPGSNGDPRVLFDQHSQRWFVIVTDFSGGANVYIAVSLTDDAMGSWFKTSFYTAQGGDAGRWPDYPTLGVDQNGLYTCCYMVGGNSMTIFAVDKAPLVAASPSLGTVSAFRNLPWEGAMQPAHTYGSPVGEYIVSTGTSTSLNVRRVNPPLTQPTLTDLGSLMVPAYSDPPNAPALGSSVPLNTVGSRLMMSVYRNGSLWTTHTIDHNGRAACRWYQIDPQSMGLVQVGTVADSSLYYFFPSIMVDGNGNAVMGFTGSNASQYAGCYFTGRLANDMLGMMAPPAQYKIGTAAHNNIDSYGRNRWGDYSYTTLDPVDDTTIWTLQEYGHANDIWGTYMAKLSHGPIDCNGNTLPDACDLDCGPAGGACDLPGCGGSTDCNGNGVLDECDAIGGGDFDIDGDVDLDDFAALFDCLAGPDTAPTPTAPECAQTCLDAFDLDNDGDCDADDFAALALLFTGS